MYGGYRNRRNFGSNPRIISKNKLRILVLFGALLVLGLPSQTSAKPNIFNELWNRIKPKPPTPTFYKCQNDTDCEAVDDTSVCSDTEKICIGCNNANAMCSLYHSGEPCTRGLACVKNPSQRCVYWQCQCDDGTTLDPDQYCGPFYLNGSAPEVTESTPTDGLVSTTLISIRDEVLNASSSPGEEQTNIASSRPWPDSNFVTSEFEQRSLSTNSGKTGSGDALGTAQLFSAEIPSPEAIPGQILVTQLPPTLIANSQETSEESDATGSTSTTKGPLERTSTAPSFGGPALSPKQDEMGLSFTEAHQTTSGSMSSLAMPMNATILPGEGTADSGITEKAVRPTIASATSTPADSKSTSRVEESMAVPQNGESLTSSNKEDGTMNENVTNAMPSFDSGHSGINGMDNAITTTWPASTTEARDDVSMAPDENRSWPVSESEKLETDSTTSISDFGVTPERPHFTRTVTGSVQNDIEVSDFSGTREGTEASKQTTPSPTSSKTDENASRATIEIEVPLESMPTARSIMVAAGASAPAADTKSTTSSLSTDFEGQTTSTVDVIKSFEGMINSSGIGINSVSTTGITPRSSSTVGTAVDVISSTTIGGDSNGVSFKADGGFRSIVDDGIDLPSSDEYPSPAATHDASDDESSTKTAVASATPSTEQQDYSSTTIPSTVLPGSPASFLISETRPTSNLIPIEQHHSNESVSDSSLPVDNGNPSDEESDRTASSPEGNHTPTAAPWPILPIASSTMTSDATATFIFTSTNDIRIKNSSSENGVSVMQNGDPFVSEQQSTVPLIEDPLFLSSGGSRGESYEPSLATTSFPQIQSTVMTSDPTGSSASVQTTNFNSRNNESFERKNVATDTKDTITWTTEVHEASNISSSASSPSSQPPNKIPEQNASDFTAITASSPLQKTTTQMLIKLNTKSTLPGSNTIRGFEEVATADPTKITTQLKTIDDKFVGRFDGEDSEISATTVDARFSLSNENPRGSSPGASTEGQTDPEIPGRSRKSKSMGFSTVSPQVSSPEVGNETNSTESLLIYSLTKNFKGLGPSGYTNDIARRITISRVLTAVSLACLFSILALLTWKAYFFKKRIDSHLERTEESDDETLFEVDFGYRNRYRPTGPQPGDREVVKPRDLEAGSAETSSSEVSNQSIEVFPQGYTVPAKVQMVNLAGRSIELGPVNHKRRLFKRQDPGEVTLLDASYGSGQLLMKPLIPAKERLRKQSNQSVEDYCEISSPGTSRCLRINVAPSNKLTDEKLPPINGGFAERDLAMGGRKGSPAAAAHAVGINKFSAGQSETEEEDGIPVTQKLKKLKPGYKRVKPDPKHLAPVKVRKYKYPSNSESNDTAAPETSSAGNQAASKPDFESAMYSPMFPPFWRQLLANDEDALPLVADVIRSHEETIRRRKQGDTSKPPLLFGIGF